MGITQKVRLAHGVHKTLDIRATRVRPSQGTRNTRVRKVQGT